jgi:hypothetical protein
MKTSELIKFLETNIAIYGDEDVLIDTGMALCVIDLCEQGASDEGCIISAGDLADEV